MARAVEAAETVRGRTAPNPWVGAVVVPTGHRRIGVVRRGHRPPGWAPRRGGRPDAPPGIGPRAPPSTSPSSRVPTTAAPPRAPTPSSDPVSGGWWWPSRTPTRQSVDVGWRRCEPRASTSRSGWAPTRRVSSWRPTASTGAPAGRGWCSSWPPPWTAAPRPRTGPASGSPGAGPAATPTASGPSPTPCWWGRARFGPTTRR